MQDSQYSHILDALRDVKDPDDGRDIVSAGMVSSVRVDENRYAVVVISVDPARGGALEGLRQQVEQSVLACEGVEKASAVLTAERKPSEEKSPVRDPHGMHKNPVLDIPARKIIVVASGKGGVGKSTVAANLAVFLSNNVQLRGGDFRNYSVGLLDADIYGPSQPTMMGGASYTPRFSEDQKLLPFVVHGLKMMSIGFMVDPKKALIWRGPMAQSAFYQMLRDVYWSKLDKPLDYLIIDMPPGTGDIQLTLAQKVKVDGAIIVSTPQDVALIDARRAVEMFKTTDIPVLGLVENMSTHICSNCGHEEHIFGHGGAKSEAEGLNVPFLGEIPLSRDIRFQSDAGVPSVLSDKRTAEIFAGIVDKVIDATSSK